MSSVPKKRKGKKVDNAGTDALREAIEQLAPNCDGARSADGKGFNKLDSEHGNRLAAMDNWARRHRVQALKLVEIYHKQLSADLLNKVRETNRELYASIRRRSTGWLRLRANLVADAIKARAHFAKDSGGQLYYYYYRLGVYLPGGEEHISRAVKQVLHAHGAADEWSIHIVREVTEYIRVNTLKLCTEPLPDLVNLKNGVLNIKSRELEEHDPGFLSPIQIPVAYDPKADCPRWERFIKQIFPKDAQDLAWEIIGHLLVPDTSLQKAFLLLGEGGNGKSTFLNAVIKFVGADNVSNVSLQQLASNRFAAANLVGKLANICADLPTKRLEDTQLFKGITGGDTIQAERKFKTSFSFQPYARLLFSANRLPQSPDSSEAFFDRWIIVPFGRRFRGTKREVKMDKLLDRLTRQEELSGVLNKALDALDRLRRARHFTEPESTIRALSEYRAITDCLQVWLEGNTIEAPESRIEVAELRTAFNDAARREGRPPMTETEFGIAFKRLRPQVRKTRIRVNQDREWFYFGIGRRPASLYQV